MDIHGNSNPLRRCEGVKRRGGGGGKKKIRLPDIIVLLGNSVRWQTELLIGAPWGSRLMNVNQL